MSQPQTRDDPRHLSLGLPLGGDMPWLLRALNMLEREIKVGREMTGEKIRFRLIGLGLERPPHPNAWGSLMLNAASRGLLVKTGKLEAPEGGRSHGKRRAIWRRV